MNYKDMHLDQASAARLSSTFKQKKYVHASSKKTSVDVVVFEFQKKSAFKDCGKIKKIKT